jgi:hypothetical protein
MTECPLEMTTSNLDQLEIPEDSRCMALWMTASGQPAPAHSPGGEFLEGRGDTSDWKVRMQERSMGRVHECTRWPERVSPVSTRSAHIQNRSVGTEANGSQRTARRRATRDWRHRQKFPSSRSQASVADPGNHISHDAERWWLDQRKECWNSLAVGHYVACPPLCVRGRK